MNFTVLLLYLLIYFIRPAEWIPWLRFNWQMYFGIIAIIVIFYQYIRDTKFYLEDRYGITVLLFFTIVLMSKLLTGWLGGALVIFDTFLPSIVIYFLIQISCTDTKKMKYVLSFVLCLSAFIGVSSILQFMTGEGFGGITAVERLIGHDEFNNKIFAQQVRWYGVFNDPNDLGMVFVACVPFALQQLLCKRILYIFPLSLIVTGVILTNSRGTFLSLIITVIAYFLFKTRNMKGLIFAGLICSILIIFGPSRISQLNSTEESAIGRMEAWIAAFQMFKQSPFYGIGPGNFTDNYFITAHNSYMLALAETGFLGLMCFIGITIVPLWNGIKMIFNTTRIASDEDLLCSALAGFVGTCISIFFISRTYMLIPYMMSALVIASMKICDPKIYKTSLASVKFYPFAKITVIFIFIMFCIAKTT